MDIKTVSYQEIFNLGNYCSQRIGVEVAVNPGENAKQALEVARNLVHEYHQQTAPDEIQRGTIITDLPPEPTLSPKEAMIKAIESCTEIDGADGLLSFKRLSENDAEIKAVYDLQFLKLKK